MKILFYWCDDLIVNKTQGIEILSLKIIQKEHEFANAVIELSNENFDHLETFSQKYAKIECNEKTIFVGRLIAFPISKNNASVTIELIAEPVDYQQKLQNFSQKSLEKFKNISNQKFINNLISYDDLFFSKKQNPSVFLEGDTKLLYWDPANGNLELSDVNFGEKIFEIDANIILKNSFRVRLGREPYKKINVSISAEWIQNIKGVTDIFPFIAQKFELRKINSFTKLKEAFLSAVTSFNQKGYNILHTEINEINPNNALSNFPLTSPKFYLNEGDDFVTFERFYYDGKILLEWNYKQKRIETVNFSIKNSNTESLREKNVYITLNEITLPKKYPNWISYHQYENGEKIIFEGKIFSCKTQHYSESKFEPNNWEFIRIIPDALKDDSKSSFFSSERGKNAIKFALQKAIANMCYSNRYIEISFAVEAKDFLNISLKDEITILNQKFWAGKISGKVIKKQMVFHNNHQILIFSIACYNFNVSKISLEELNQKINKYIENIDIKTSDELHISNIIKSIEIINPPESQINICENSQKSVKEIENNLMKCPTKIKMQFHPISTVRRISNAINLNNFDF